jgi:hypothetical protein
MPRKLILPLTFLALTACLLAYKFGSASSVFAKPGLPQGEMPAQAAPPTLPTAPATWTLTDGAVGARATVTEAAGGAGVQHVATCIAFSVYNFATANQTSSIYLMNGSTIVWQYGMDMAPGTTSSQSVCGLNIVGSANTAMTLEAGIYSSTMNITVNLVGYDAQ